MVRTFIYGSCVSRDTFEFMDQSRFQLARYVARQSLASAYSPARHPASDLSGLGSPFQRRMLEWDERSALPALLREDGGSIDLLVWDIVDERLGYFEFADGSIITNSVERIEFRGSLWEQSGARYVPFGSDEHFETFSRTLDRFVVDLSQLGLLDRVAFISLPWANLDDQNNDTPPSFGMSSHRANSLMERYIRAVRRRLPRHPIGSNISAVAGSSHTWGVAPFHYTDETYIKVRNAITLEFSHGADCATAESTSLTTGEANLRAGFGYVQSIRKGAESFCDSLLAGKLQSPPYPEVEIGSEIDWSLNCHDDTWLFRFHNLQWVYPLFSRYEATGESKYRDRAESILKQWAVANLSVGQSSWAWDQHATALRAKVYAYSVAFLPPENWLAATLTAHGDFLADPANYAGAWNHGLDEDLGLLAIGGALGRDDWIDFAADRSSSSTAVMVDTQGVTNEQAVSYHHYDWQLFEQLVDVLKKLDRPIPEPLERRHAIPTFLAHATQPDGRWVSIGDSLPEPARSIPNTPLEYAASKGRSGMVPIDRIKVYDRGWIFGRTGWGTSRPYSDESFYSIRFGPGRGVHGHRDHTSLTYFARGGPVITEAGFGGYGGDRSFRDYEQLEDGHNHVSMSGHGPYQWSAATQLAHWISGDGWQRYQLTGNPYQNVRRQRDILFIERPEAFVVRDTISAPTVGTARQLWHLAPGFDPELQSKQYLVASDGRRKLHIYQTLPIRGMELDQGRINPPWGWVAVARREREPAPVAKFRQIGANIEFLTVIGLGGQLRVSQTSSTLNIDVDGNAIQVRLGSLEGPTI